MWRYTVGWAALGLLPFAAATALHLTQGRGATLGPLGFFVIALVAGVSGALQGTLAKARLPRTNPAVTAVGHALGVALAIQVLRTVGRGDASLITLSAILLALPPGVAWAFAGASGVAWAGASFLACVIAGGLVITGVVPWVGGMAKGDGPAEIAAIAFLALLPLPVLWSLVVVDAMSEREPAP